MPIIYSSNGTINRDLIKDYIRTKKKENPDFKVLDVGGTANPWCDDLVDGYVDIVPHDSKKVYMGDINSEKVWKEIGREKWDFCICTHTLEDIRDPKFVIDRIQSSFQSGFISIPNKHTEFSNVESKHYLGYCHHRWIFQITSDGRFRAIAKMPIVNLFNKYNLFQNFLFNLRMMVRRLKFKTVTDLPSINWTDHKKASHKCELAFLWEKDFSFEYINGDFAGKSCDELARLYLEELKDGL